LNNPGEIRGFFIALRGKCVADYAILRVFLPFREQVRNRYKWLKYAENCTKLFLTASIQKNQSEFMKS